MASLRAFPSVSFVPYQQKYLKTTVLGFKNQLNLKKMSLFHLKCSSSSTTPAQPEVKKIEAAQPSSFSEEILEEQRILFGRFIDEVVAFLYLPPHRQEVELGQWLDVTNLAVSVLFPGKHDILYRQEKNSFEYITDREEQGEFVLMEKGFLHLLNEEKVGFMAYFDVVEKKIEAAKQSSFSEEILEEQRILFGAFIDEVVAFLYLPPYRQKVKLGQWLHVTNQALSVLFQRSSFEYIKKMGSFEYITERKERGEFVLTKKGFLHLLNKEKVGFMAYFDVVEKKKKKILNEAEEKEKEKAEEKEKEAKVAKKKKN